MQIYAIKLFNFFKFRENNNSIVFDLSPEQKQQLKEGEITLDSLYEEIKKDPFPHIKEVKGRGITNLIGITGIIGDESSSNGAGKSTVLEAIAYALYDKICRKLINTDGSETAGMSVITRINSSIPKDIKLSYVEMILDRKSVV